MPTLDAVEGVGSDGYVRTVNKFTVLEQLEFPSGIEARWGNGDQLTINWETADANAAFAAIELPTGGVVDVPVLGVGIGLDGVDLGMFNGFTQPMVALIDADRDSYVGFHYSADDTAVVRMALGGGTVRNHAIPDVASSTLAVLGATQTWTADQTFNDNVKVTLGTGGDADLYYDGTNVILNPAVVGSGDFKITGGSLYLEDNEKVLFGTGGDSVIYYDGTDTFWDLAEVGSGKLMMSNADSFPSPDTLFHLWTGTAGAVAAASGALLTLETATGNTFIQFLSPATGGNDDQGFYFGDDSSATAGAIVYRHANNLLTLGAPEHVNISATGVLISATSAAVASGGSNVIVLANGAPETTQTANSSGLYAKDVSSSSELFGVDESETSTQLTPHPADFLNTIPLDRLFPWSYHAENPFLGLNIKVDMEGAIRALEQLTGETFLTITSLASKKSWADAQEDKRLRREDERADALVRGRSDPGPYTKKAPPKWMKDRGVN